jgi:hypothetical protein
VTGANPHKTNGIIAAVEAEVVCDYPQNGDVLASGTSQGTPLAPRPTLN